MKKAGLFLFAVFFASLFAAGGFCGERSGNDAGETFKKVCSACHGTGRATSKKKSAEQWKETVLRMKKHGAAMTDDEAKAIIDYLTKNYGK